MKNLYSEFTRCYPISKTLRFSLLPQGKTLENIKKYGILEEDHAKLEAYKVVKQIFDQCHRWYMEQALAKLSLDWEPLATALLTYQKDASDKNKKALEAVQKALRTQISKRLKADENYKLLEAEALIKAANNKLAGKPYEGVFVDRLTEEELEQVAFFDRFATYFTGYGKNRANMY